MAVMSLRDFTKHHKQHFPLLGRLFHEQKGISALHGILEAAEVVVHGWARQSKVLAVSKEGGFYAVPLTYQAVFVITSRCYGDVVGMVEGMVKGWVKVVRLEKSEGCPMVVGDVVKVVRVGCGGEWGKSGVVKVVRRDTNEMYEIPMRTKGLFVEDESECLKQHNIKDLSCFLKHCILEVEVIKKSDDCLYHTNTPTPLHTTFPTSTSHLPTTTPLLLTHLTIEKCILTSIKSPSNPIFHIPLRSQINIQMLRKLDKSCGPFGREEKVVFSSFDRCVEVLSFEDFASLLPLQATFHNIRSWISGELMIKESNSTKAETYELCEVPPDGNLFHLKHARFIDLLRCLRLQPTVLQRCCILEIDGRKFNNLSTKDLTLLHLNHPVLNHFKHNTFNI